MLPLCFLSLYESRKLYFITILTTFFLSACGHLSTPSTDSLGSAVVKTWPQQKSRVRALQHWSLTGKLAIRSVERAYNLRIIWIQRENHFSLKLSGPIGWKHVTITSNNLGGISILRDGQISSYANTEDFALELPVLFNWGSTIQALPSWLKGVPYPPYSIDNLTLSSGLASGLQQHRWAIQYPKYQSVKDLQLPRKITMRHEQTFAKILINHWTISDSEAM